VVKTLTYVIKALLCLAFLGALGCVRTTLNPRNDLTGYLKLNQLSSHPVQLKVIAPDSPITLGHQYLLIAIPFGTVSLLTPKQVIFDKTFAQLTLKGFRVEGKSSASPLLEVTLKDLSATAYDLIVTRRVRSLVKISIRMQDAALDRQCLGEGRAAEYRRFGFEPQLTRVMDRALEEALMDAFNCLGFRLS
jgi:hypothetical protein